MQSKKCPLSVAARLIYHLGEQLISDEWVALLELIKNAYDADATRCIVKVDSTVETPYGQGIITIEDNGNGMLPHTVTQDFLRLATDYKKNNKISPFYKRRVLGEKGLGRLSYQRLGRFLEVHTIPRIDRLSRFVQDDTDQWVTKGEFNCMTIAMDWEGVQDNEDIDKLYALITPGREMDAKAGTKISIHGIKNLNFWNMNDQKRRRVQDEILALINPFIEMNYSAPFYLEIDVNGERFWLDAIQDSVVDELSDVSCSFSFHGAKLVLEAHFKDKYIYRQKDQYIKRCNKDGFIVEKDQFDASEFAYRKFEVNLENLDAWKSECQIPTDSVNIVRGCPAVDFEFDGKFYIVDKGAANKTELDQQILRESNLTLQKMFQRIGKLWDRISGVYMYRDQFRILPYGKNDWLGFTRRSQKEKATILKVGNVSGYIHIDGKNSETIREQTNRQGILEDEYGTNFLLILDKIITEKIFRWDVLLRGNFVKPHFDKATSTWGNADQTVQFKKGEATEDKYEKAKSNIDQIVSKVEKNNEEQRFESKEYQQKLTASVEVYREATENLKRDYLQKLSIVSTKLSEYEEIIPMLGQAMLIEMATHELKRIYSELAQSASDLMGHFQKMDFADAVLKRMIFSLKRQVSEFDLQLNHIMPTQRYKLKDVQNIDIFAFLEEQYIYESAISRRLKQKGISCVISGESFTINASVGNLIVIFDNMVLNAEYWLEVNNIKEKKIFFECMNGNVMRIWDSGFGMAQDIENILFEPFQTMKREGRGLGLYIVRELLALLGAKVELLQDRNAFGNRYMLEVTFRG